jgi:hypothetical protein
VPRQFVYPGPFIVRVKGGLQYSGGPIALVSDLGLTEGPITFTPKFNHRDMLVDDYGPFVPAAVQSQMTSVDVSFTLIHYDQEVLQICIESSMGNATGAPSRSPVAGGVAGTFVGQGRPLDAGRNMFMSGNCMISLNLFSISSGTIPIRVRSTYLTNQVPFQLGTEVQAVQLTWRGIPYQPPLLSGGEVVSGGIVIHDDIIWRMRREMTSSGAVLWDFTPDFEPEPEELDNPVEE